MATCYYWEFGPGLSAYYDLGEIIQCTVQGIWGVLQIIFIAMALILVSYLIFRVVTNRENSTVLQELSKQWMYVALLAVVAIGGAGTAINILLKFIGFGDVQYWLDALNQVLRDL